MHRVNHNPLLILLAIFLEGFVSISIEILTIRQLMPVAGSSVIVTSLIIGVFLLFLAIGYWSGGTHAKNFITLLKRNFAIGAGFIGIGLSYPFILYFFASWSTYPATNSFLVTLTSYLLLIIAPTVYFLGQTVPLTMNLLNPQERTAKIGGKVLFISTLGSFLGAPLTSLLFMEFWGIAWSVFLNFAILTLLILLFTSKRKEQLSYLILALLLGWLVYYLNISFEHNSFVATTNYANYSVITDVSPAPAVTPGKILEANNSAASFINRDKKTFPYNELIKHILFDDLQLTQAEILVLGAGGFTLSAETTNNNHFTYVDIDPKIKTIVTKHFFAPIQGDFIAQDARVFLTKLQTKYDVIISDTYSNLITVPPELLTQEYFTLIKQALKPEGIAIFNIIANPFLNDPYSKRVDSTIRAALGNCMAIPLQYKNSITNIIYLCHNSPTTKDKTIYTDNLNSAAIDVTTGIHTHALKLLRKK